MEPAEVCKELKVLSTIPKQSYFDDEFEREIEQLLCKYDKEKEYDATQCPVSCEILDENIKIDEILKAIKANSGKSPGIDRIPVEFIKATSNQIVEDLQILYNYILNTGAYPNECATGL